MASLRSIVSFVSTVVAVSALAPSAFAQTVTTDVDVKEADRERDHERLCRDRWFGDYHRCRSRHWKGPVFVFGADFGLASMEESSAFGFKNGVGAVSNLGPAWGASAGIELFRWLALEARYIGVYNSLKSSVAPTGSLGYLTTGANAVVRFTLPLPFVHPYIFGGVGYYSNSLTGSDSAKAGSPMISSSQPGVPMGFGIDVPLTWHVSVGGEATYHFMVGESFSNTTTNGIDGGDITTFNGVIRFRL